MIKSEAVNCPTFRLPPMDTATTQAFWARVHKGDDCWIWLGSKRGTYGVFRLPIQTRFGRAYLPIGAHRLAYCLEHGTMKPGRILLHSCDTPLCVKPDHLREGTPRDNSEDASRKGRLSRYWVKLPDEEVKKLRLMYFEAQTSVGAIARQYRMSKPGIIAILTGEARRTVGGPTGPIRKVIGKGVFGAKLDEQKVAALRGRFLAGETIYELAPAFGIAPQTVSNIIRNRTWRHVKPIPPSKVRRGHRKLDRLQVMKIRQRHAAGVSQTRLAHDYRLSTGAISLIVNRKVHR